MSADIMRSWLVDSGIVHEICLYTNLTVCKLVAHNYEGGIGQFILDNVSELVSVKLKDRS